MTPRSQQTQQKGAGILSALSVSSHRPWQAQWVHSILWNCRDFIFAQRGAFLGNFRVCFLSCQIKHLNPLLLDTRTIGNMDWWLSYLTFKHVFIVQNYQRTKSADDQHFIKLDQWVEIIYSPTDRHSTLIKSIQEKKWWRDKASDERSSGPNTQGNELSMMCAIPDQRGQCFNSRMLKMLMTLS